MNPRWALTSLPIAALLLGACTTTTAISRPPTDQELEKLNRVLQGREVELRLTRYPQETVQGTNVSVQAGEVSWTDPNGERQHVPAELLRSLKYLSPESPRSRGWWQGSGLGFLIGGLGAALITGLTSSDASPCSGEVFYCFSLSRGQKALLGGILFGLVGALVGGATGVAIGHHDQVDFTGDQ
jgi:hypothetical protein